MKLLVVGGTGTVGSRVVGLMVDRGHEVRVTTRNPAGVSSRVAGAHYIAGDLEDAASLTGPMRGVDKVFLLTPLHPDETRLGSNGVEAARDAGAGHVVFLSVHRADRAPHVPHFKSKIDIVAGLRDSGLPYTVISPNNFFQNDVWFRQALTQFGLYPQPIGGRGMSRVDVRDIADAVALALEGSGHEGRDYPLVGPDAWTGEGTAEAWGRHLGREVRYAGDDLEAWAVQAGAMMSDWLVEDLRVMYEFFQKDGLEASDEDLAACRRLLGREPRGFDGYAEETARGWG